MNKKKKKSLVINCGYAKPFGVLEIIKKFSSTLKVGGLLAFEIGDKQWNEIKKELVNNSFKIIDRYKLINDEIRCVLALKL